MSETKHTPLPWRYSEYRPRGGHLRLCIGNKEASGQVLVARDVGWKRENLKFIVQTVNAHAKLEADSKKLREPATCNAGHKSNLPLALWDCPVCTQLLRDELNGLRPKVEELVKVSPRIVRDGDGDVWMHMPNVHLNLSLQGGPIIRKNLLVWAEKMQAALREVEAALKGDS